MGGSMGSAVGEKLTRAIEVSLENSLPFISISASGGARNARRHTFINANGKNISSSKKNSKKFLSLLFLY